MIRFLAATFSIELLKVRKSMIFGVTIGFCVFISLIMALMMVLIMNPGILPPGLLKTKVNIAAVAADWPSYFSFIGQAGGAIGIILFGFISAWTFGREFSDRTLKDLLALPAPRSTVVFGKLLAIIVWSAILALVMYITSLPLGIAIGLPGWSANAFAAFNRTFFFSMFLNLLLCPAAAFVASAGRGTLPAIGFLLLCLGLANFFGTVGWGAYFPWAIPMMSTGAVGGPGTQLHAVSYLILALTCASGIVLTVLQWKYADHNK